MFSYEKWDGSAHVHSFWGGLSRSIFLTGQLLVVLYGSFDKPVHA